MIKINKVGLEFLRHGPAHNQLLSPLTQYLGLCGNFGACTVQVPYEHQEFLARLKSLRYNIGAADDVQRRQHDVNTTAKDITDILGRVPGLVTSLGTACSSTVSITHLDLVLSAAELAMLPFELAKVPAGCDGGEGNYLLLQTLLPVCLTRRVRSTSSTRIIWPRKFKILFVIANPAGLSVPAIEHTKALLKAIEPWIPYYDPSKPDVRAEKIGEILTILPDASIKDIEDACAVNAYSHVHILAHGMGDEKKPGSPYGLVLHDPHDKSKIDVVGGEQMATALRPLRSEAMAEPHAMLPIVVTVAACDSGNVSSVIFSNGTSLAHNLHQAGIPVVVASQFPLSKIASVHVAEVFYKRILWGDDPRIILHALRGKLSTLCPDTHDWASLVMYASLPPDIETQLLEVRYTQAKKAIDNALARIDETNDLDKKFQTGPSEETLFLDEMERNKIIARVEAAASYMPITEGYETEGRAMLASTEKRKAEVYFRAICDQKADAQELKKRCLDHLWKSLSLYGQAYRENMREAEGIVRKNRSVHWVMTQYLSLRAVLGKPILPDHWGAAKVSADVDMDVRSWNGQAQTVAWAHGSLAELYLILMAYDPADIEYHLGLNQEQIRQEALEHTQKALSISGQGSFLVASTLRQFKRYLTWWGNDNFAALLAEQNIPRPRSWSDEDDNKVSLNALAKQLISELEKPIG